MFILSFWNSLIEFVWVIFLYKYQLLIYVKKYNAREVTQLSTGFKTVTKLSRCSLFFIFWYSMRYFLILLQRIGSQAPILYLIRSFFFTVSFQVVKFVGTFIMQVLSTNCACLNFVHFASNIWKNTDKCRLLLFASTWYLRVY